MFPNFRLILPVLHYYKRCYLPLAVSAKRSFSVSSSQHGKGLKKRQHDARINKKHERYLQKFLGNTHKKHKWIDTPVGIWGNTVNKAGQIKTETPRTKYLAVVFQNHISSLIHSGEACTHLVKYDIEISKVVIPSDFSRIEAYWLAYGTKIDQIIGKHLEEAAHHIRTILTGLRVIGHVPKIQFHKDMSEAKLNQVMGLLAMADMGPDYKSSDLDLSTTKLPCHNEEDDKFDLQKTMDLQKMKFIAQDVIDGVYAVDKSELGEETEDPVFTHREKDFLLPNSMKNIMENETDSKYKQLANFDLRSDIYNLDHTAMMQKLNTKRKQMKYRQVLSSDASDMRQISHSKHLSYQGEMDRKIVSKVMQNLRLERKRIKAKRYTVSDFQESIESDMSNDYDFEDEMDDNFEVFDYENDEDYDNDIDG